MELIAENSEIRTQALKVLGVTAAPEAIPVVKRALDEPLAWMKHPRAEKVLIEGFRRERDSNVRAHILSNSVHLMSPVAEVLMVEALTSSDQLIRQTAEYLQKTFHFSELF
jgi:hypothetical protein